MVKPYEHIHVRWFDDDLPIWYFQFDSYSFITGCRVFLSHDNYLGMSTAQSVPVYSEHTIKKHPLIYKQ